MYATTKTPYNLLNKNLSEPTFKRKSLNLPLLVGGKQKIVQKPHFKVSTCLEKKVLNISQ